MASISATHMEVMNATRTPVRNCCNDVGRVENHPFGNGNVDLSIFVSIFKVTPISPEKL